VAVKIYQDFKFYKDSIEVLELLQVKMWELHPDEPSMVSIYESFAADSVTGNILTGTSETENAIGVVVMENLAPFVSAKDNAGVENDTLLLLDVLCNFDRLDLTFTDLKQGTCRFLNLV